MTLTEVTFTCSSNGVLKQLNAYHEGVLLLNHQIHPLFAADKKTCIQADISLSFIILLKQLAKNLTAYNTTHQLSLHLQYTSEVMTLRSIRNVYMHTNKSAQSNLGKQPRCGAVAHVHHKVPIGYNGAPQIRYQKYPFPWTYPQTPLPVPHPWNPSDL